MSLRTGTTTVSEPRIRKDTSLIADLSSLPSPGFSNSILWPLFHYHPGEMNFDAANWLAYREANMRFADVVASMANAGDVVWVQDYHLMLLPMLLRSIISGESAQGEMVRRELGRVKEGVDDTIVKDVLGMTQGIADPMDEGVEILDDVREEEEMLEVKSSKRPTFVRGLSAFQKQEMAAKERGKEGVRIGFFLHTPFPSSEIYRCVRCVLYEMMLMGAGSYQCEGRSSSASCNATSLGKLHHTVSPGSLMIGQLPHLRLCPTLPLLLHPYPRPRDHAKRDHLGRPLRSSRHVSHRDRADAIRRWPPKRYGASATSEPGATV
jgi:hypothetical protein